MKLIRYSHPLQTLRDWDALFADPFRSFAPLLSSSRRTLASGVDWFEDEGHFHVRIEIPGIKREDLQLDAEEGVLRLSRVSKLTPESSSRKAAGPEWVLRCPDGVRTDGIEARIADGILTVSLPKIEAPQPVRVEIQ